MSERNDDWIDQLLEGGTPDWLALEQELGPDSPVLAQMRRTARLCAALARGLQPAQSQFDPQPRVEHWGHLQLRAQIGSGSSGAVYRAFDTLLEREVALKLRNDDPLRARTFIAEARRLAQVRHGNVLAVHGAAVHNGRAGLWADLIVGCSLQDWVQRDRPRPATQVLEVAQALASALAAVHDAGLVHGDVKPGNVLREDGSGRIVLMDFGSAAEHAFAARHGLLGSPASMAPEQRRAGPTAPAADLYGLGVVLFYLASGHYPELEPDRPAGKGTVAAQVNRLPLPLAMRRLLRSLLASAPQRRPTAAALQQQLERIVSAPKRRRRLAGWLAVVVALSVGLGVALWQARVAQREAARAGLIKEFLVGLFELGDPDRTGQGRVDAGTLLRLGADRAMAEFSGDPELRLELARSIAGLSRQLGDYAQGLAILDAVLAEETGAARLRDHRAGVLIDRAALHLKAGQAEQARLDLAAAEQSLATSPGSAVPERIALLLTQARLQQSAGEFPAARQTLEQATVLSRQHQGDGGELVARSRYAVAELEHSAGQRDQARTIWSELLVSERERLGERHTRIADLEHDLGVVAVEVGDQDAAERHFQRAADLRESLLGQQHPMLAQTLRDWGGSKRQRGDFDAAEQLYRRALAIVLASLGERHPEVARTYNALGVLLHGRNDLPAAREAFLHAREIFQSSQPQSPVLAALELNLASVELRLGQWQSAQAGFESALDRLLALYGEHHPVIAATLTGLYRLAWLFERDQEAWAHLQRAEAIHEVVYQGDHMDRWAVAVGKARMLLRFGRLDEAAALSADVAPRLTAGLPADHSLVQELAMVDGQLALVRGDAVGAAALLRPVVALRREGRDRHPFGFAETAIVLAQIELALAAPAVARSLLQEAERSVSTDRLPPALRRLRDDVQAAAR